MRVVTQTKALVAASANNISLSQSLAAAGNLLLNGSTGGVLDTQRRVLITSAGDDHLLTWTITGTNDNGSFIKDAFAGSNGGTSYSNFDFLTVTQIASSGATASTVTAGTNTIGSTPWVKPDSFITPFEISMLVNLISGTGNVQVEYIYALDEVAPIGIGPAIINAPAFAVPVVNIHAQLQNLTANAEGALDFPVSGYRLRVNSGTGKWSFVSRQAGRP